MNVEKLAMIEKAKCVFSPYEIATPSVINTVNLMADFALEQTAELRDEVKRWQILGAKLLQSRWFTTTGTMVAEGVLEELEEALDGTDGGE